MEHKRQSQTFDPSTANNAQNIYCQQNGLPRFAPDFGVCWYCKRNIFHKGGYSVERAGHEHITGCPFCYRTYCD